MKRLLAFLPMLFALTCVGAQEVLRVDFRENARRKCARSTVSPAAR